MKTLLIKVLLLFAILFAAGGVMAVGQGLGILNIVLKGFFPIFYGVGKLALEEYLSSPYFIVAIIIAALSGIGFICSVRLKKFLYTIISIACEVVSVVSILGNLI